MALATSLQSMKDDVVQIAGAWAKQRHDRQRRRSLDPADFDELRRAHFHLCTVPVEMGGFWETRQETTRDLCETLRALAHADSSVALVASMHPAVMAESAGARQPELHNPGWEEQRRWIFETILEGAFWGPIASEPGSGGDMSKTQAVARPGPDGRYLLSGQKHFATGSGIVSYTNIPALVEDTGERAAFYADMRGLPWDGSAGVRLAAAWDGHGMTATQSHAFEFADFPVMRSLRKGAPEGGLPSCLWSAVALGIVETALETAREQIEGRRESLRTYEVSEWTQAELEVFLITAAYESMLRSIEHEDRVKLLTLQGKQAIAQLAESAITRICRVIGGATFGRGSPFGFWFEDIRALGFLRPPWGLAFDELHAESFRQG